MTHRFLGSPSENQWPLPSTRAGRNASLWRLHQSFGGGCGWAPTQLGAVLSRKEPGHNLARNLSNTFGNGLCVFIEPIVLVLL